MWRENCEETELCGERKMGIELCGQRTMRRQNCVEREPCGETTVRKMMQEGLWRETSGDGTDA